MDVRRQAFRIIDANSFGLMIDGNEIVYTRLRADCHTRGNDPPPPPEINGALLRGTWDAVQGNGGLSFALNNRYKKLTNIQGCAEDSSGTYELAGNLLTLNPGNNGRPLFYSASMLNENSLRLTDDGQQVQDFTRSQANCHGN
jgi:hypothetical protein